MYKQLVKRTAGTSSDHLISIIRESIFNATHQTQVGQYVGYTRLLLALILTFCCYLFHDSFWWFISSFGLDYMRILFCTRAFLRQKIWSIWWNPRHDSSEMAIKKRIVSYQSRKLQIQTISYVKLWIAVGAAI